MMRVADYIMHRLTEEELDMYSKLLDAELSFSSDGLAKHKGLVSNIFAS